MKRHLSVVVLPGLLALGIYLSAQQTPSQASPGQVPSPANPDKSIPRAEADTTNSQPSARAFEGRIQKSAGEFVLQESATRNSYRLDDQDKAKRFEGKDVRVMATMDTTNNNLHVIDITRSDTE